MPFLYYRLFSVEATALENDRVARAHQGAEAAKPGRNDGACSVSPAKGPTQHQLQAGAVVSILRCGPTGCRHCGVEPEVLAAWRDLVAQELQPADEDDEF